MKTRIYPTFIATVGTVIVTVVLLDCYKRCDIAEYEIVNSMPRIEPDYTHLVVPPNIAPMNFTIQETGDKFLVKIYADSNDAIQLHSRSPHIKIPSGAWRHVLQQHVNKSLYYDIYVYDGRWIKYQRFTNKVAAEPIDRYLVYRSLRPNYTVQKEMHIRRHDLETHDESLVMTTKTIAGCINCHSFRQNDPAQMLFHIRWGPAAGTIFAQNGHLKKIDTRTEFNPSPGAYPSWHPNGIMVAFSVNKVQQFFHATGSSRDVIDLTSDIIIYQTESNTVEVEEKIASPLYMESFPSWSPDGRTLYFCRAPQLAADFDLERDYRSIKYDLMRVQYDPDTEEWGELETLIYASQTGKSCSQPRVSPDGKFLVFCMAEYGNFPILHASADLYLLSLDSRQFQRLSANSDAPEGFHSWSSNSRWIVFTSKRDNGVFTRLYFSYIDSAGLAHKPFILPLKNPEDYQTRFIAFSVPELIVNPIPYRPQQFIDVALDSTRLHKARLKSGVELLPPPAIGVSRTATDFP